MYELLTQRACDLFSLSRISVEAQPRAVAPLGFGLRPRRPASGLGVSRVHAHRARAESGAGRNEASPVRTRRTSTCGAQRNQKPTQGQAPIRQRAKQARVCVWQGSWHVLAGCARGCNWNWQLQGGRPRPRVHVARRGRGSLTRSSSRWRRFSQFHVFGSTCAPIRSLLRSKVPSHSYTSGRGR